MKRRIFLVAAIMMVCVLALASCQGAAESPTIGENGNWFIGDEDTGVSAIASSPTVEINDDGYWVINGAATDVKALATDGAKGEPGTSPTVEINGDGFWVIDGTATDVSAIGIAGKDGAMGMSPAVTSCEKTSTSEDGLVDTYTLTFSNGSSTTFDINKRIEAVITVKDIRLISYSSSTAIYGVYFTDDSQTNVTVAKTIDGVDSSATLAYNAAVELGYIGSFDEFAIAAMQSIIDSFGTSNSPFTHAKLVSMVIPEMMLSLNEYFVTESFTTASRTVTVTQTVGYVDENGEVKANATGENYAYSQLIDVTPGDKIELRQGPSTLGFKYVTAYDASENVIPESSVYSADMSAKSYNVPNGVEYIRVSIVKKSGTVFASIVSESIITSLRNDVTAKTLFSIVSDVNGGSVSTNNSASDIVVSAALGATSISATADVLEAGQYLTLEANHIMNNKQLTLTFKIDSLGPNDVIRLGHGETEYCASYVELTATTLTTYSHYAAGDLRERSKFEHGLTIKDFVNITIAKQYNDLQITVGTGGGVFESGTISGWDGTNGSIFALSTASDINDVTMRWNCSDYSKSIWMFGDSYFSTSNPSRWTSYLVQNGYADCLMSAYPGRTTASALADFERALEHGTPQFAVWCMGMNDADIDGAISSSYLRATERFIEICNEKGITPILSTTPNVPERDNSFKNDWVRSSGYRYIDFALAVGGEEVGSSWYDGMLYTDLVHPDVLGAKALYVQFITDFPEIMRED